MAKSAIQLFGVLMVPALLGACSSGAADQDPTAGGSKPGVPPTSTPAVENPTPTELTCSQDAPFPRRILRLSERELLASVRSLSAIADQDVPELIRTAPLGVEPDGNLAVTRSFHDDANTMAIAAARGLAQDPALQSCGENFGLDAECTARALDQLGTRIFRGPSDAESKGALAGLAAQVAQRSGGAAAFEITLRAMLLSPRSLYTTEGVLSDDGVYGQGSGKLSNVELASYLSYRIGEVPPSASLLAALADPASRVPSAIEALLLQQLGSDVTAAGTTRFLAAWLNTDQIGRLKFDAAKHPTANGDFLAQLQAETVTALTTAASDPGLTLRSLLLSPHQSQISADAASGLASQVGRPGVFSLPGVLAAASGSHETNIPRRGRFLLKNLFCETLANPPASVLSMEPGVPATATQRERFARVEREPACAGCHARIDHLALPFERYNELGQMRLADEHGNQLDPSAQHSLPDGTLLAYADAAQLMELSSQTDAVQKCVTVQAFRNLNRRAERGHQDGCLLNDVAKELTAEAFPIHRLLTTLIVRSALAPREAM